MQEATVQARKAQLDAALENVRPNMGIAFGEDLFHAFRAKGWITLETFSLLGTTLFECKLPAYNGHFASPTWDFPGDEFRVGKDA